MSTNVARTQPRGQTVERRAHLEAVRFTHLPAILGGAPAFTEALPHLRPTLPDYDAVAAHARETFDTGMVTKGRFLEAYEKAVAAHLGVKYAIGVSSCTTGLMLALRVLGLHGEVIVPSFTFMATVKALGWNGLQPVFVDIDRRTFCLDPRAVEAAITTRTSAILAVHVFGNPAPIDELTAIAQRHGVALVLDAAHGFGAQYDGVPLGRFGLCEVFSTSPTKLLVTGEGGIVSTDSDEIAEAIMVGREYGNPGDYGSIFTGMNARLPEFSAIMGLHSLALLEENALRRGHLAHLMHSRLSRLPGLRFQEIEPTDRSSYKDFAVVVEDEFGLTRDQFTAALDAEGIPTRNYYVPPVHEHATYRQLYDGCCHRLPETDDLCTRITSPPCYSRLSDEDAEHICAAVERIWEHRGAIASAVREPAVVCS